MVYYDYNSQSYLTISLINDSIKYDEPDANELEMLREDRKKLNKLIRFILLYAESNGIEIEE